MKWYDKPRPSWIYRMIHRWWLRTWNLNQYHEKVYWWTPITRRIQWNTKGRTNLGPWLFLLGSIVIPATLAVVIQILRSLL